MDLLIYTFVSYYLFKMKGRKLVCQSGPTNTYVVSTPIGDMEIVSCPRGLHSLQQMAPNDQDFTPSPG